MNNLDKYVDQTKRYITEHPNIIIVIIKKCRRRQK